MRPLQISKPQISPLPPHIRDRAFPQQTPPHRSVHYAPYTAIAMQSPVAARLLDVSKLYGPAAALRPTTTEFAAGKCYLILGENGAGKSTLLRIIAGLAQPTSGKVLVFGEAPHEVRHRISYMGHETMLYDDMTARENLRYFASLFPDGSCLTPEKSLEIVGLLPNLEKPIKAYSQGMRQRVSLARALMTQADLLLLDEPFSNMDQRSTLQLIALLQQLRSAGQTLLLTTHQAELARPLADFTITLEAGRISTTSEAAA
jgi:heme ABC exporter ATP-binding subunit CcmA